MGNIRISEKHGVNPSIQTCFWCGKDMGIILFGKLKGDIEAPKNTCTGYEPCDECKGNMSRGITIMEASQSPVADGQGEMQSGVYPTGRWSVITKEAGEKVFGENSLPVAVGKCFMDIPTYTQMLTCEDEG